jgi:hypothetical protein
MHEVARYFQIQPRFLAEMFNCVHLYGWFDYGKGYNIIWQKGYNSFFGAWYDALACTTADKSRQKSLKYNAFIFLAPMDKG